jgi:hypothetical protein
VTLPPTSNPIPYTTIRPTLKTGDLVFLHGISPAGIKIEEFEELADWPPFSHVGMVVKDGDDLFFWDAPGGGWCYPDPYASDSANRMYNKPVHTGCRVAPLDSVLAYYVTRVDDGGLFFRQLAQAPNDAQFEALRIFINQVDGQPFPTIGSDDSGPVKGLLANYAAGQLRSSSLYGTYFCAQLVAESYMRMGLLAMELFPPNGYSPAAFAMTDQTRLPLIGGASLGDVSFVSWDWTEPVLDGVLCPQ